MRSFYYPLLVVIAFVGLTIVAGNMRMYEQTEVCVRCGRVRETARVSLFGAPFEDRTVVRETAFSRAWTPQPPCTDLTHLWRQTDYYAYQAFSGSYRHLAMSDAMKRVLDDPAPALLLRQLDPKRGESLLQELVEEASQSIGYGYWRRGRWVVNQAPSTGVTGELLDRLRQGPMTTEELRRWYRERQQAPVQPR